MKQVVFTFLVLLNLVCFFIANTAAQRISVTLAGTGVNGLSGNGGPAVAAKLSNPVDVCIDAAHNVFILDAGNSMIREIAASTGVISTIAGGGSSTADGVPATSASLTFTQFNRMGIDAVGNIYVSTGNCVRKVNMSTGIITTVAGTGTAGYTGDGSAATLAQLSSAQGICVDAMGNIYIADEYNCCVRKVTATTGIISTLTGNGTAGTTVYGIPATAAQLPHINSICVDDTGNVFCTGRGGSMVSEIVASSGLIRLVGSYTDITGICSDRVGNIIFDESSCGCHSLNVATGAVAPVANIYGDGFNGDGGNSLLEELNTPAGLCVDVAGGVLIADQSNNRVRLAAELSNLPSFIFGSRQTIESCPAYPSSLAPSLAVDDLDTLVYETWTVVTAPATGLLSGFPASAPSRARAGLMMPTGTLYSPGAGVTSAMDSFTIQVSNGSNSAIKKILVSIQATASATVTGATAVCQGYATSLTGSEPGLWSTANPNASVDSYGRVTGVLVGPDTVIFTPAYTCMVTTQHIITVNPLPDTASITGPDTICSDAPITLSDAILGGVWDSHMGSATGEIIVGSTTGVITGTADGTALIKYTVSSPAGCLLTVWKWILVNAPVLPITGSGIVCLAATTTLTESVAGGTWIASNGNATVVGLSSGNASVSGVTTGIDTLFYSNTNSCGTESVNFIVAINPAAEPGIISGAADVCLGTVSYSYAESVIGGIWSTTNSYASISASGMLTPHIIGIDTIIYTVNNGCHTANSTYQVVIESCPAEISNIFVSHAMSVFPNPSYSTLNISCINGMAEGAVFIISNLPGKELIRKVLTGVTDPTKPVQIPVSNLVAGTYLLTFVDGTGRHSTMFEKL